MLSNLVYIAKNNLISLLRSSTSIFSIKLLSKWFRSEKQMTFVTIMCHNDELSSTLSWVGCLLPDSKLFILFAESSQNPSQNFCYSHSLKFHLSGSTKSVSKQPTQLNVQLIIAAHNCHTDPFMPLPAVQSSSSKKSVSVS